MRILILLILPVIGSSTSTNNRQQAVELEDGEDASEGETTWGDLIEKRRQMHSHFARISKAMEGFSVLKQDSTVTTERKNSRRKRQVDQMDRRELHRFIRWANRVCEEKQKDAKHRWHREQKERCMHLRDLLTDLDIAERYDLVEGRLEALRRKRQVEQEADKQDEKKLGGKQGNDDEDKQDKKQEEEDDGKQEEDKRDKKIMGRWQGNDDKDKQDKKQEEEDDFKQEADKQDEKIFGRWQGNDDKDKQDKKQEEEHDGKQEEDKRDKKKLRGRQENDDKDIKRQEVQAMTNRNRRVDDEKREGKTKQDQLKKRKTVLMDRANVMAMIQTCGQLKDRNKKTELGASCEKLMREINSFIEFAKTHFKGYPTKSLRRSVQTGEEKQKRRVKRRAHFRASPSIERFPLVTLDYMDYLIDAFDIDRRKARRMMGRAIKGSPRDTEFRESPQQLAYMYQLQVREKNREERERDGRHQTRIRRQAHVELGKEQQHQHQLFKEHRQPDDTVSVKMENIQRAEKQGHVEAKTFLEGRSEANQNQEPVEERQPELVVVKDEDVGMESAEKHVKKNGEEEEEEEEKSGLDHHRHSHAHHGKDLEAVENVDDDKRGKGSSEHEGESLEEKTEEKRKKSHTEGSVHGSVAEASSGMVIFISVLTVLGTVISVLAITYAYFQYRRRRQLSTSRIVEQGHPRRGPT